MNPEQQRIAIAEACGWTDINPHSWHPRKGELWGRQKRIRNMIPDYLNDLNAMHEAEKILLGMNTAEFAVQLCRVVGRDWPNGIGGGSFAHIHATASQRAEAFLRTLNLWKQ